MNTSIFTNLLNGLSSNDWQAVFNGAGLLMLDDQQLVVGPENSSNLIIKGSDYTCSSLHEFKEQILSSADRILSQYYLSHPLSEAGFKQQVEQLINKYGVLAFAAANGDLPVYSLFVEGGEIIVEDIQSPRHQYGVFCELDATLPNTELESYINSWLTQGDAYQRYLAMNVCRYNC